MKKKLYQKNELGKYVSKKNRLEIATVLDAAADYLREYGWQQYSLGGLTWLGDPGPACAMGAIGEVSEALHGDKSDALYQEAVYQVELGVSLDGEDGDDLADWNDDPDRTADEVINKFMDVAASLRERRGS